MMVSLLEKGFLLGVGLLTVTKERTEKVVDELIEKGKISYGEKSVPVKDLLAKADEKKKALEARIDSTLEETLHRFDIPTRKDLEKLNKKLDRLTEEVKKKS